MIVLPRNRVSLTPETLTPESDDRKAFEPRKKQRALLLESLDQARRGEGVDGRDLLEEL